jgi:hypothetical protein
MASSLRLPPVPPSRWFDTAVPACVVGGQGLII